MIPVKNLWKPGIFGNFLWQILVRVIVRADRPILDNDIQVLGSIKS